MCCYYENHQCLSLTKVVKKKRIEKTNHTTTSRKGPVVAQKVVIGFHDVFYLCFVKLSPAPA